MSGILAVVRTDGAQVDEPLVASLLESLTLKGPDQRTTWCDGPIGLGHALFRTTHESALEYAPLSLDARVWIVADGRVDARGDLIESLDEPDPTRLGGACDTELILRAYLRWGADCVDHLLGDFAFVVWDGRSKSLFCARDHMGVKPFYYAHVGGWLLIASAIETLLQHPHISLALNDQTIADILLFAYNPDASTTSFRDVRRLPAAHVLQWSADSGLNVRRYWTLPMEEPVYYRRPGDYVERFTALVRQAVSDRLRTDRVGVMMSGGLDSSLLAVTALDLLGNRGSLNPVQAFTGVYRPLTSEGAYAEMVAGHLGIPIHLYRYNYEYDDQTDWMASAVAHAPEPPGMMIVDGVTERRYYAGLAAHSRVSFLGEGPDNALRYEWTPHIRYLLRTRQIGQLLSDVGRHVVSHRRVPLLPTIPRMIRKRLRGSAAPPTFPSWLADSLVERLHLREHWQKTLMAPKASGHPARPFGYASMLSALWQNLFESLEPSYTGVSLENRHPYVDLRLLQFMLRVPAMPWCRRKHLVRESLRGVVPEPVRRRPKTPIPECPELDHVRRRGLPAVRHSPLLARYGDPAKLPQRGDRNIADAHTLLRFVTLSYWLSNVQALQGWKRRKTDGIERHALATSTAAP